MGRNRWPCSHCCGIDDEANLLQEMETLYGNDAHLLQALEAHVRAIEEIPGVRDAALERLATAEDEFDFEAGK